MPDKPQTIPAQEFRLPGHAVLALHGRDAAKFAQAQFMSDVTALAPGHWHWSGWLTPKGRVIALFALLKLDDETLWMLLPDSDAGALAAQLQRYLFRSKLVLEARNDLHANAAFAKSTHAAGAAFARTETGIELDLGADGGARTLRLDTARAGDDETAAADWRRFDLQHGLPRLPESQREHWTPQQLSLERLKAFSVKKGCYPGQEIVARTHFLGQAKRGLALFESDAPLSSGNEVLDGERAIGSIVSVAGSLALVVLPPERGGTALTANGTPLVERPMLGGLAR